MGEHMIEFFKKNNLFLTKDDFSSFFENPKVKIVDKTLVSAQKMEYQGFFFINENEWIFFHLNEVLEETQETAFIQPKAFFTLIRWIKDNKPYRDKGPDKITYEPDTFITHYYFESKNKKASHLLKHRSNWVTQVTWKKQTEDLIVLKKTNLLKNNKVLEKVYLIKDENLFFPDSWVFDFKRNLKAVVFNSQSESLEPIAIDKKDDLDSIDSILNFYSIDPFNLKNQNSLESISEIFQFNFGLRH
jgi:hypothetical protein